MRRLFVFAGRVRLDPDPSPTAMYETKALFGSGLSFVVKRTFRLFAKVHAGARRQACTPGPKSLAHSLVKNQSFVWLGAKVCCKTDISAISQGSRRGATEKTAQSIPPAEDRGIA